MRLALYQPDIPQNTGTLLRLCACLDVACDIIEPCGFPLDDAKLRRAGMDYLDLANMTRRDSWEKFLQFARENNHRLVLLTTKAEMSCYDFRFQPGDILLLGRESMGAPQEVHEAADAKIKIPMQQGARSLNVAIAGAMVLGEALRQCAAIKP